MIVGILLHQRIEALDCRSPALSLQVVLDDQVLMAGQPVQNVLLPLLCFRPQRAARKSLQHVVEFLDRLAGLLLIAVGPLHLLVGAHGDLQHRIIRAIAAGVAVDEISILVLRFHQVHRIALLVEGIGNPQQRPPTHGIVRIIFVEMSVVRTGPGKLLPGELLFSALEELLFGELHHLQIDPGSNRFMGRAVVTAGRGREEDPGQRDHGH